MIKNQYQPINREMETMWEYVFVLYNVSKQLYKEISLYILAGIKKE